MAIHTSIIESERSVELSTGVKYIVRLIYGSYNYVKEEFNIEETFCIIFIFCKKCPISI